MAGPAVAGEKLVGRVFRGLPALESVAVRADPLLAVDAQLRVRQRTALGDKDLALDNINAGDHLGDGVLNLNARVDLDEEELASIYIEEKFDGAGIVQADFPAHGQSRLQ